MRIDIAFSIYFALIILIMFLILYKANFEEFKTVMRNKRAKKIKRLSKDEILKRELKKDLQREKRNIELGNKLLENIEDTLNFIKLNITINQFFIASISSGLFGFVIAYIIFSVIYIAIFGFLVAFFLPYIMITNIENKIISKANKYTTSFISNLRETSIGSNNSLNAIENTIKTLQEPMKSLIKDSVDKAKECNIPIENSIGKLALEMKNDYFLILSIALRKQKQTGTFFREYLNSIFKIIKGDEKIKNLNIKETKYGTKVFQMLLAIYLLELTVLRLFFKENYEMLIADPRGQFVLNVSLILMLINGIGIYIIRKK